MTPALQQCFVVSYVVLAPLVGAFADSMPKGRVMLITNAIKVVGCMLMLFTRAPAARLRGRRPRRRRLLARQVRHPDRAPAGASSSSWPTAGSKARPSARSSSACCSAACWSATRCRRRCSGFDLPRIDTGIDTPPEAAICVIAVFYVIAAIFNWYIPNTGVDHRDAEQEPVLPHPRVLALRRAAVARQAGPDLARHDDAVLGRRRDAPVHRARVGREGAGLRPVAGVVPAGRRRRRHRARRRDRRHASSRCAARSTCCRSASRWASS